MSAISDFNRIEDCDKIDAQCVNAYVEAELGDGDATLHVNSSWGDSTVDLSQAISAGETLTTLYLSPAENPNCLVYEPERGDNVCIHGDDLSRIISLQHLKDVEPGTPADGIVYEYDANNGVFRPFDLKTFVTTTGAAITALQDRVTALERTTADHETRIQALEALLTKPANSPNAAKPVWGTINLYSDHTAQIDASGDIVSLDKTHGFYSHDLNTNLTDDEILG